MVMEVVVMTANKCPERETRRARIGSFIGIPSASEPSRDGCGRLVV
jgi:hypothetical protein